MLTNSHLCVQKRESYAQCAYTVQKDRAAPHVEWRNHPIRTAHFAGLECRQPGLLSNDQREEPRSGSRVGANWQLKRGYALHKRHFGPMSRDGMWKAGLAQRQGLQWEGQTRDQITFVVRKARAKLTSQPRDRHACTPQPSLGRAPTLT